MYKKGAGNDKQGKDAGNRTLCPYRNFSQAIIGNTKPIRNSKVKKYIWENTQNKASNFIHGHEFKFLAKQTNKEVHSSSVNLEEKV